MAPADGGELQLIAWLRNQTEPGGAAHTAFHPDAVALGDDMATVSIPPGQGMLLASDMLLEGTHFDLDELSLHQVGRKALAVCLSDAAAMAVRPVSAVVSLGLPRGRVWSMGQPLLEAMLACAAEFDCTVVGGDTTSWDGPLAIDVSLAASPWPGVTPVRRSGGRPGDALVVSGPLGGSRRGHHANFVPRVREARDLALALGSGLHAMIDISDGLALDIHRLCSDSHCGAVLDHRALLQCASDDARAMAEADGRPVLDHVLHDGEDFELLMAIAPSNMARLRDAGVDHHVIGRLQDGAVVLERDGQHQEISARGYVHD